ncbi:hypothetical protein [Lunatibacter salilacus]|uniref:hypothetical protein n=1 Tax=Lunatibacter salilacus TaxID=2483804 RepID=UPI00131E093C|nr:hypothetical protein [Lunatibacter salilacus]
MDLNQLDKDLTVIIELRIRLTKYSYADHEYDEIEEELHDLEDDFNDNYGEDLERELEKIYAKLNSDNEVLLPSAYLANQYVPLMPDARGIVSYEVKGKQGVPIESEQFDGQDVRLVLISNPARIVMQINGLSLKDVWRSR